MRGGAWVWGLLHVPASTTKQLPQPVDTGGVRGGGGGACHDVIVMTYHSGARSASTVHRRVCVCTRVATTRRVANCTIYYHSTQ